MQSQLEHIYLSKQGEESVHRYLIPREGKLEACGANTSPNITAKNNPKIDHNKTTIILSLHYTYIFPRYIHTTQNFHLGLLSLRFLNASKLDST